jgi:hypothetical protein
MLALELASRDGSLVPARTSARYLCLCLLRPHPHGNFRRGRHDIQQQGPAGAMSMRWETSTSGASKMLLPFGDPSLVSTRQTRNLSVFRLLLLFLLLSLPHLFHSMAWLLGFSSPAGLSIFPRTRDRWLPPALLMSQRGQNMAGRRDRGTKPQHEC